MAVHPLHTEPTSDAGWALLARLAGRPLTAEDRRVVGDNLSGFFSVLSRWAGGNRRTEYRRRG